MRNDNTIKITLEIDKKTGAIEEVNTELDKTSKKASQAGNQVEGFTAKLKKIALAVGAVAALNMAFSALINSGFSYNNTLEQQLSGLVALNVATSSNISAMGKQLSMTEKYNLANIEAHKTLKELEKINAATPHTLGQTAQIYKAMYVSMKKVGASSAEMVKITEKLSIAAGAAGIEFNSLLAGVDGLATGTVLANSDLGRFLGGLGLTNETLKESSDVVALLESKLSQFRAADTMSVAVSNLQNSWDQLSGTMTSVMFDDTKGAVKNLSFALADLNTGLNDYLDNVNYLHDIRELTQVADASRELQQLKDDYNALEVSGASWYQSEVNFNAELNKKAFLIKSLERHIKSLEKAQDSLKNEDSNPLQDFSKEIAANNAYYAKLEEKSQKEALKAIYDYDEELRKNKIKDIEAHADLLLMIHNDEIAYIKKEADSWKSMMDEKIKAAQEVYKKRIDADPHFFDSWTESGAQSLADAVVQGLQGQDVMSAIDGLMSGIGNSAIQIGTNSLMSDTGAAAGNFGGLYGIAGGMAITAISSAFTSQGEKLAQLNQELNNEITNRLDKQIALAEQAGGLADSLKRTLSYFDENRSKYGTLESSNSSRLRFDIGNPFEGVSDSLADLNSSFNDVKDGAGDLGNVLLGLSTGGIYTLVNQYEEYEKNKAKMSEKEAQIAKEKLQSSFLGIGSDLLTFANEIDTFSESLKGYSDDIYGTTYKQNEIDRAVAKTNQILGGFTNGLDGLIESLELKDLDAIKKDLASTDLSKQNDAIRQLENALGETFISAEEALGNIDALNIGLGYMSNEASKAAEAANNFYNQAEKDQYGAHLSWLDLLDTYNTQVDTTATAFDSVASSLDSVSSSISTLESAASSVRSVLDKLGEKQDSNYNIEQYNDAMREALVSQGGDVSVFAQKVQNVAGYSDALLDDNNFDSSLDARFARAVAQRQFESFEIQTETELDVLKRIDASTSTTSGNTSTTASNTDALTLWETSIAGLETQIISQNNEIKAIKNGEFSLFLGQTSSNALGDIFDGFFGTDGSLYNEIDRWLGSNELLLDFDKNGVAEAIRVELENGMQAINVDLDQDGIIDVQLTYDQNNVLIGIENNTKAISDKMDADLIAAWAASTEASGINQDWVIPQGTAGSLGAAQATALTGYYRANAEYTSNDDVTTWRSNALLLEAWADDFIAMGGDPRMSSNLADPDWDTIGEVSNGFAVYADAFLTQQGFAHGGYTGDGGTSDIAGLVHGQEFVINAPTTRALGLNEGNGGIFKELLKEQKNSIAVIENLLKITIDQANEIRSLKKEFQDQNTTLLSIEEKIA